jgi:hypothetical protein
MEPTHALRTHRAILSVMEIVSPTTAESASVFPEPLQASHFRWHVPVTLQHLGRSFTRFQNVSTAYVIREKMPYLVFSFPTLLLSSFSPGKGSSKMQTSFPRQQWLEAFSVRQGKATEVARQRSRGTAAIGIFHTLPETCRQPQTWRESCELMIKSTAAPWPAEGDCGRSDPRWTLQDRRMW